MEFALQESSVVGSSQCDLVVVLDPLCEAGKTVAGAAKDVATAPFRYAANSAVDMVTSWVTDGAHWLLGRTIHFIQDTSSPRLDSAWFQERFDFMVGLGALVLLPLLIFAAMRAILMQDVGQLARSFGLYLPVAVLGTFLAIFVTSSLLEVTDSLSEAVSRNVAGDTSKIFDSVGATLTGSVGVVSPTMPTFVVFLGSILVIVGAFLVWLELLVRSAAVTVSVFFLPVILAALVWPATMRWTRRLIEILVALILSKFVIVAVISLATAAISDPGNGGFGTVMGGGALMLMAAMSPFALLRLMPMVEASAIDHLDRSGRKPVAAVGRSEPVQHVVGIMKKKVGLGGDDPGTTRVAVAATGATASGGASAVAKTAVRSVGRATGSAGGASGNATEGRQPPVPRPKGERKRDK